MFGDRLDVHGLAELMQRYEALHAYVDDAHGMSWCGARGAGSLVHAALPRERTVIATSLGKGFGCSGGLLAVPDELTQHRIQNLGPSLMFSIQIPPPVLGAIVECAKIHLGEEIDALQLELRKRIELARTLLRNDPRLASRAPGLQAEPTPIGYVVLGNVERTILTAQRLLARGFLVNPVSFPAVPMRSSGVRFTLTRSHTVQDVQALIATLGDLVGEACEPSLAWAASVTSLVPIASAMT